MENFTISFNFIFKHFSLSEASLRMVAPFIGQNIGEDQKKKKKVFAAKRVGVQFAVRKYVMTKKKKRSLPTNQWVFGLKRKKQNGDTRGEPPHPP